MPDGTRRARVGILRDTYRNLYGTTLKTWHKSFPPDLGHFRGSDDRPATHTLNFPAPLIDAQGQPIPGSYGPCELIVEMRAIGSDKSAEATCRGWELTGAFVDEMDLMPEDTLSFLGARTIRYPNPPWRRSRGVWGAFNKTDVDSWIYQLCMEEKPDNLEFFDQPPGLLPGGPPYITNPDAENLVNIDERDEAGNLTKEYYPTSANGRPEWYIRRLLRNEWGASVSGEPIYPMFRDWGDASHVLKADIWPQPRDELYIGMDGGGTPAAVIAGRTPTGRIVTYAELVIVDPNDPKRRKLQHGVGPRRFAEALRDLILFRFPKNIFRIGYCDPAAFYGADRERGEYSWPEIVQNVLTEAKIGCAIQPAPSNEIDLRLEAVRTPLLRLNDTDAMPSHQINPSCTWLRRGYVADYKYEQRDPKQPGKTLKPQKSVTSHVHDAEQYLLLGMQGRAGVVAGAKYDHWQPGKGQVTYGEDPGLGMRPEQLLEEAERRRQAGNGGQRYGGGDFDIWG